MKITYNDLILLQEETLITKEIPSDLLTLKTSYSPSNHYEFLYLLTKKFNPNIVVELGTYIGLSALFMYKGNSRIKLYTIDIKEYPINLIKEIPSINCIIGHSCEVYNSLPNNIDLIFLDTNHDYELILNEYIIYSSKMNKGGLMLFDDILNPGTNKFWRELNHEKLLLNKIHSDYGFGAIII